MLSLRDIFVVMENDKELRHMILGEDGDKLYEGENDAKNKYADAPEETVRDADNAK